MSETSVFPWFFRDFYDGSKVGIILYNVAKEIDKIIAIIKGTSKATPDFQFTWTWVVKKVGKSLIKKNFFSILTTVDLIRLGISALEDFSRTTHRGWLSLPKETLKCASSIGGGWLGGTIGALVAGYIHVKYRGWQETNYTLIVLGSFLGGIFGSVAAERIVGFITNAINP